ncbi:MAG: hypothetical protein KIS85_06380 [Anaerolineales bacterium]|nr:hypothetical protein [Anaerolineales bacterium]
MAVLATKQAMLLGDAVLQRLEERRRERSEREDMRQTEIRRRSAEQADLRAEIENALRDWFRDELQIVLPDEVALITVQLGLANLGTAGTGLFEVRLLAGASVSFWAGMVIYPDGSVGAVHVRGGWRGHRGLASQGFGDFVDAVIYALGGEQAFGPPVGAIEGVDAIGYRQAEQ